MKMGDKPKEKLPTQMFGSPVFQPPPTQTPPAETDASVRGRTLPPPPASPIQPRRPDAPPAVSRALTLAERVAEAMVEVDPDEAEQLRQSISPPPPPEDEEETTRLSDISQSISTVLEDEMALADMLEGLPGGESLEPTILVEPTLGLDEPGEDVTTVIATGDEAKRVVQLPSPAEPAPSVPESEEEAEPDGAAFNPSPDDIPTIPPPDASAVRVCISEMRKVRNSTLFPTKKEEEKAPHIDWIDQHVSYRLPIADGERIVIGRSPDCDVVIDDKMKMAEYISARHAEVRREGDACFVRDLQSLNDTWINDILVAPGMEREVFHMEMIMLGGKEGITLFFVDPANANKKRPQVHYASTGRGVSDMSDKEMRAPKVEVDPALTTEVPPPETDDPVLTTPDLPAPAEPEAKTPEETTDPDATAPMSAVSEPDAVIPPPINPPSDPSDKAKKEDDRAKKAMVAETVPLEVTLPVKKTEDVKPASSPVQKTKEPPPPSGPTPPPLPTKQEKKTAFAVKVLAAAVLLFIAALCIVGIMKAVGNVPAEVVADIEPEAKQSDDAPAMKPAPVPEKADAVEPEGKLVVDEEENFSSAMDEPMEVPDGWVPVDPGGPLAVFIGGRKAPRRVEDCLPKSERPLPELDVIRCCEYLPTARLRADCVFDQVAQVLRTEGGI